MASNPTKFPTNLATVLAATGEALETQKNTLRELRTLNATLRTSQVNAANASSENMAMLKNLGDLSKKAAESAAASEAKCSRLDLAFDSQLGEVTRLRSQIDALQQLLQQSWLQRQLASVRTTWAALCRDTRGISRGEWLAARRVFLRGARFNRWLWRGTMVLLLVALLLAAVMRWA